jgi:hypothetical protein
VREFTYIHSEKSGGAGVRIILSPNNQRMNDNLKRKKKNKEKLIVEFDEQARK